MRVSSPDPPTMLSLPRPVLMYSLNPSPVTVSLPSPVNTRLMLVLVIATPSIVPVLNSRSIVVFELTAAALIVLTPEPPVALVPCPPTPS